METKTKLILSSCMIMSLLLVVSSVTGYMCIHEEDNPYSFDNSNEVHEWRVPQQSPVKTLITKDEYNQIFEDYRNKVLTRQEASTKIKGVRTE